MSDFFSKKQKKWWCDQCKKFIEYTNISIDQHKRSKNHQRMVQNNMIYENKKARAKKLMESTGGIDHSTNENIRDIEKAAIQSFNSNDAHRFSTDNLAIQYKGNNKRMMSEGIMSHRETYNMSNNLLEEIKLEKLQAEHQELFSKSYLKKKKNREWGIFFDEITQSPYYYNFLTRVSQWEKPHNYDGPNLGKEEEGKKREKEVNSLKNTIDEVKENIKTESGIIGQWQEVDPKESFFEKFKAKENDIKENFYSEVDFINKINGDEEDSQEEDNEENDGYEKIIKYSKGTIDDYIIGKNDFVESNIPILEKDDIININEKLKNRDYDLRYVNQSFTNEEKNINIISPKESDELKEGQTISFNFKNKKADVIKKVKKPLFFDSD